MLCAEWWTSTLSPLSNMQRCKTFGLLISMKWFSPACAELAMAESSSVLGMKIGFPYLPAHIETQPGFLSLHSLLSDDNVPW